MLQEVFRMACGLQYWKLKKKRQKKRQIHIGNISLYIKYSGGFDVVLFSILFPIFSTCQWYISRQHFGILTTEKQSEKERWKEEDSHWDYFRANQAHPRFRSERKWATSEPSSSLLLWRSMNGPSSVMRWAVGTNDRSTVSKKQSSVSNYSNISFQLDILLHS